MNNSCQSQPAEDTVSGGNVIRPNVLKWSAPDLVRELVRLCECPTVEQLDIFSQNIEAKGLASCSFSLFTVLFREFLDRLPKLPPLTTEQRLSLFSQIVLTCLNLTTDWMNAAYERMEKGFKIDP